MEHKYSTYVLLFIILGGGVLLASAAIENEYIWLRNTSSEQVYFNHTNDTLCIGEPCHSNVIVEIRKETAGILRHTLYNPSNTSSTVNGALYLVRNNNNYWGGMGMTGPSTLQGGKFTNTFHIYNQGYENTIYTVDGNKSHVWNSDPTDGHNFGFDEIMELTAQGTLKPEAFELKTSVEEDLRFPVNSIKIQGASNTPNYETFLNTTYALMFDDSTMEQAFLTAQMPHGWKEGTNIEPHFHWTPTSTNEGSVKWCIEYTWSNIGETFQPTTTLCDTQNATGTANDHQMAYGIEINGSGKNLSSIINIRIYRDATSDTYTDDAALLEFDIHYKNYRLGKDV